MPAGKLRIVLCVAAAACFVGVLAAPAVAGGPLKYPETKKGEQFDDYHGVKVADPYRWLENLDSEETAAWVKAENEVTFGYLETIPCREQIKNHLTKLWNYERYGLPFKEGGRYFYFKNDGLQNQSVLYTTDSLAGEPRVLIDPNTLSEDGTIALSSYAISKSGKLMAYGVSGAGSDWQTFRVRDVDAAEDKADELKWIKFSGASWTADNMGFFYTRYDAPRQGEELEATNYYNKVYYHRVGTKQDEDVLVYQRLDQREWNFGAGVTDDGRFLIVSASKGTERENRVFYIDLESKPWHAVPLIDVDVAEFSFIDNDGPVFWFRTDLDAPKGRVVAIDIRQPDRSNWKEIIPEAEETLDGVGAVNNMFVCDYLKDAHTQVKIFDLEGKFVREVSFPTLGTAGGFGGKRNEKETFYSFSSFNYPTTIYRYDMETGKSEVNRKPKVDFDPDAYVVKQVFYTSQDGTKVPMFITHRKGIKLDGNNPTLLYGYGGFNISITPGFRVDKAVWMDMGGVYAVANIRGGGEYGKAWHNGGRLDTKQNCFDDFIAAAEWLIANKYTTSKKLGIQGGSNGGLLVGACMTQRPDLFGACLPAVGVMDILRFQYFTIGWAWVSDYGDSRKEADFKVQYAYSPLQNIKKGTCYPPTMVTTGDHDDRVVPSHSFKFTAAMQAAQSCDNPILIRIETRGGHGGGKPTSMVIEEITDEWAFLANNLGVDMANMKGW